MNTVYVKAVTKNGSLVASQLDKPLPVAKGVVIPPPAPPPLSQKVHLVVSSTPRQLWDNYRIIGETVKVPNKSKYVVSVGIRQGVRYLLIWLFYYSEKEQKWRAARTGVSIPFIYPINDGMERITPLYDILKLVKEAVDTAVELPLADTDYEVFSIRKDYHYENF